MKLSKELKFAALSGALAALAFPPLHFPLLAFIAFIPILSVYDVEDAPKKYFRILYFAFWVFCGGVNWWISSWRAETDPFLMASGIAVWLAHPFFYFIPFLFLKSLRKKLGDKAIWAFPFIWTTFEWAHSLGELSFPWASLGNTQIYNIYWAQIYDLGGVWLGSFLIMLFNVVAHKLIKNYKGSIKSIVQDKAEALKFAILALIIIVPYIYGGAVKSKYDYANLVKQGNNLNIGLVQTAENPWRKWRSSPTDQVVKQMKITDSLAAKTPGLDLAIWPETSIMFLDSSINVGLDYSFLNRRADERKLAIMSGFAYFQIYNKNDAPPTSAIWRGDSNQYYQAFNTAIMVNPAPNDKKGKFIYKKSRLTPFAEKFPYSEKIPFAQSLIKWGVGISSWGLGKEQYPLDFIKANKSVKIGSVICIESIYPDCVYNFTRAGAQILTVITNDAWYDYTAGPEQHFQIAAVRAIENRRFIARCANTGISGFISASGETILLAPQYESLAIAATIPALNETTFYVRYGDWVAYMSLFICIGFLFIRMFVKLKKD